MVGFTKVGHQCNADGDPPLQTSKPLFLRKTTNSKVFTIALMTDTASAPWFYWQMPFMPTLEPYIGRYRAYTVNGRVSANIRILHRQIRYLSICTSKFLRIHSSQVEVKSETDADWRRQWISALYLSVQSGTVDLQEEYLVYDFLVLDKVNVSIQVHFHCNWTSKTDPESL